MRRWSGPAGWGASLSFSDGQSSADGPGAHELRRDGHALETAASLVATGADVAVLARTEELTSQQAADFLNVSRQYMVRLLEGGDIASTRVGTHRRIRSDDLAQHRHRRDEGRAAALADMADQAQAAGGYDKLAAFGPRRRA